MQIRDGLFLCLLTSLRIPWAYTGVLLSSTAVPLWGRAKHILGPLFLTSGLSAALASLSFIFSLNRSNEKTLEKLEDAEILALTTELGFMLALPSLLGPLGKPLVKGKLGLLFMAGAIGGGMLLPLRARLSWKLRRKHMPRSSNSGLALLTLLGKSHFAYSLGSCRSSLSG